MGLSIGRVCLPIIFLAIPAIAHAQASDGAVERFKECAAVEDDAARLACFDKVTKEVRATAAVATGREVATKQRVTRREREDFGLTVEQQEARRPVEDRKTLKQISVRVAASRRVGPGYYAIMFEDGAIWQVTELDPFFRPPGQGDTVRIRRGVMGGYLLYTGGQASIRIRRVS